MSSTFPTFASSHRIYSHAATSNQESDPSCLPSSFNSNVFKCLVVLTVSLKTYSNSITSAWSQPSPRIGEVPTLEWSLPNSHIQIINSPRPSGSRAPSLRCSLSQALARASYVMRSQPHHDLCISTARLILSHLTSFIYFRKCTQAFPLLTEPTKGSWIRSLFNAVR